MIARVGRSFTTAAALALFGSAIGAQMWLDRTFPRDERQGAGVLYVRSGEALQRMVLSYDALAADVYWIRAIQHYGGNRLARASGDRRYDLLFPLLDLTTTLDPYFKIAYRFGAIFLSERPPGGPGRPDQAVTLLRKALAARPGKWEYYHDIAFVYYWNVRDHQAAASWFKRAAEQPGAPIWLAPVAASMLTQGNDRASARFLWQQILQSDQEWMRATAERSLLQIDALDQMDRLDGIVGRCPPPAGERHSWLGIVGRCGLRGIPVDPTRTPYELDPETGRVTVAQASPLFPMPDPSRNPTT